MSKQIISAELMREAIKLGMKKVADIVGSTLGPGGKVVALERQGQSLSGEPLPPILTKDGVSVALETQDPDPIIDLVIQSVKDICVKTNKIAGDGPQPLYSKILTPTGFITMSEAKIGTTICGTNGSLQQIIGVFPKGSKEIFKVRFSDGREVECCEDHLWTINTNTGINKTLPLKELRKDYKELNAKGYPRYKYYVQHNFVEFESNRNNMPLDPYLVGILIGDGSLTGTGAVELFLGKNKEHILSKINLPEGMYFESKYYENRNYFRVKLKGEDRFGKKLIDLLNEIGLAGCNSSTKHIPRAYLYANKKDREALLRGLLDTDGHINKRGRFEFSTISETLAKDFTALVRSLGKNTRINLHTRENDANSYSDTPIYRMFERLGYRRGLKIVDIVETKKHTEMQCIKVSNPDSLYITDDFVVTHNTTSAIVLGQAILTEAFKALEQNPNLNPQLVRESIEEVSKEVIEQLKSFSKPVKSTETIEQVACISANGDKEVAAIIRQAFEAVGEDGVITVDEGHSNKTTITVVDGYQFKKGAEAQTRFFNNSENNKFEADNCHVIIYNGPIRAYTDLMPAFQAIQEKVKKDNPKSPALPPVLIIADDFSQEVIMWLLMNRAEAGVSVCAVKSPHVTSVRTEMMDDIAIVLGGERLGAGSRALTNATFDDIGIAKKVVVDKYSTTLYEGAGEDEDILARIESLKVQKAAAESPYDAQLIADRIACMANGVALIGVGGTTDLEIKERYHRIEDALNAARAAMEQGVIAGGGVVFAQIADGLAKRKFDNDNKEIPQPVGAAILANALVVPFLQISENVGEDGWQTLSAIMTKLKDNPNLTYNARTKKIEDALEAGIIDPVKVSITALENAISIASLLITCGGGIVFTRKRD